MKIPRIKRSRNFAKIFGGEDTSFGMTKLVEEESAETSKPRTEEKDDTKIKCPKCGKMVNRARVVKRKYICYE